MAELSLSGAMTLVELAKRTHNKMVLPIAQVLAKKSPIFRDALWMEANDMTSHTYTKELALPSGTWKILNQGVPAEVARTGQIVEPIKKLKAFSEPEKDVVDLSPNPQLTRSMEDAMFLRGLTQTAETAFWYSNNVTAPEQPLGLSYREDYDAAADSNVEDEGGDGSDCTSIWIIQWGAEYCHLVYPRGSKNFGVNHMDHGLVRATDTVGTKYVYSSEFEIAFGICIKNAACVQRIASVDTDGSGGLELSTLITALGKMPDDGMNATIYMNRDAKTQLEVLAASATNVNYRPSEYGGTGVLEIRGIPVHVSENLLSTETAL